MNNRSNTRCYQGTTYEETISKLSEFGANSDYSQFIVCPKEDCTERIFTRFYLYRHIESSHPEDTLHTPLRYFVTI